jgi:predicted enzyme related to lactoylglutathione lyase
MPELKASLAGVELYFDDLPAAKRFYEQTLGLRISGEQVGHHVQFGSGAMFLCLEKKGVETYPSKNKAVIFLEVPSVKAALEAIPPEHIVKESPGPEAWAVVTDPEGHNIVLLERSRQPGKGKPVTPAN